MKISATGGGGFAGLTEQYQELDTQALANGKAIEAMLTEMQFFNMAADATPEAVGADMPRWQITVSDGAQRHTVSFVEDGSLASAPWTNLLAQIRAGQ